MALDAAKQKVAAGQTDPAALESLIDSSLASIDEAVRQIRTIVHNLRERDKAVGLVERIRRESSLTRSALGFAPSLLITLDGSAINSDLDNELVVIDEFDGRVDPDLSDDVVATGKVGASAHHDHRRRTRHRSVPHPKLRLGKHGGARTTPPRLLRCRQRRGRGGHPDPVDRSA